MQLHDLLEYGIFGTKTISVYEIYCTVKSAEKEGLRLDLERSIVIGDEGDSDPSTWTKLFFNSRQYVMHEEGNPDSYDGSQSLASIVDHVQIPCRKYSLSCIRKATLVDPDTLYVFTSFNENELMALNARLN